MRKRHKKNPGPDNAWIFGRDVLRDNDWDEQLFVADLRQSRRKKAR